MGSGTVVQFSVAELLSCLGLLLGVLFGIGRMLVQQVARALTQKLEGLETSTNALEKELEQLNRQLPIEYVRREDWIRFSASIDAKLDRLADGQQRLAELMNRQTLGARRDV